MSGIWSALNIGKNAIAAQQLGLSVTGHNIANVNNPEFSRQDIPHTTKYPLKYAGFLMGNGVEAQQVENTVNQLLEDRLTEQHSSLSSLEEMEVYMNVLEGYFNENSESSLSYQFSEFWSSWHDLADNPLGASERVILFEKGAKISEQFDALDAELVRLDVEMSKEIEAALGVINSITKEIGEINLEIVAQEADRNANDMRDKRNALYRELSQMIDTNSFEQPDGTLTIMTSGGFSLVSGVSSYNLSIKEGQVLWEGSYGASTDITDRVSGGKVGGWLEMRDEVLAKYKTELDVLAEDFIWNVNYTHSQGVGLNFFSKPATGTTVIDSTDLFATMDFGNRIDYSKDLKMWVRDDSTSNPEFIATDMDMGISTALITGWNGIEPSGAQAIYKFVVETGGSVAKDLEITETNGVGMGEVQVNSDLVSALDNAIANNQTIYVAGAPVSNSQLFEIADTGGVERSAKAIAEAFNALEAVSAYASTVQVDIQGISRAMLDLTSGAPGSASEGDEISFTFHAGQESEQVTFFIGQDDTTTQNNFENAVKSAIEKINTTNKDDDLSLSGTGAERTIKSSSGENIGIENFDYTDNASVAIGNFGGAGIVAGDIVSFELADDNLGTNGITVSFVKGANAVEDSENLYAAFTEGSTASALTAAGYTFRLDTGANRVVAARGGGANFAVDNIRDTNALANVTADVAIQEAGTTTLDGAALTVTITEGGDEDTLAAPVAVAARSIGFGGVTVTEGGALDSAIKTGTVTVTVEKGMTLQSNISGAALTPAGGLFNVAGGSFARLGSSLITLGGEGGFTDFTNTNMIGFKIDDTQITYPINVVTGTDLERAIELEAQILAAGLGPMYSVSRNGASVSILKTDGTELEISNFIENGDKDATLAVSTGTGVGIPDPVNTLLEANDLLKRSVVSTFSSSTGVLSWEKFDANGEATGDKGLIDLSDAGPYLVEENSSASLSIEIGNGTLVAGNTFTVNTDTAGSVTPLDFTTTGTANSILDTYVFEVKDTGQIGADTIEIEWKNSISSGSFELEGQTPAFTPIYVEVDGMRLRFDDGYVFEDDVFTMSTDSEGKPSVEKLGDWHWTFESFRDQFNKQAFGISAVRTSANTLDIEVDDSIYKLENMTFTGINGFDESNVKISVTDYRAINHDVVDYVELERFNGKWRFNDGLEPSVALIPPRGSDEGFGVDLNGDGLEDFRVDFDVPISGDGTFRFDIEKKISTDYTFAFSDETSEDAGVMAAFGINTFFTGSDAMTMGVNSILKEGKYISSGKLSSTGDLSQGDNITSLDIADLQYETHSMAQWTFIRGNAPLSSVVQTSSEGYYHVIVGSIGIESQSVNRNKAYSEVMVSNLSEQRDSISAVSLDEEMVNMMKYQHAFTVAAKLITVSDEMLTTLVNMR